MILLSRQPARLGGRGGVTYKTSRTDGELHYLVILSTALLQFIFPQPNRFINRLIIEICYCC